MRIESRFSVVLLLSAALPALAGNGRTLEPLSTEARQALYIDALRLAAPNQVPEDLRNLRSHSPKCGFETGSAVKAHFDEFTGDQKKVLSVLNTRPVLTHAVISPSGRFRVHYETTGSIAVPADDADSDGFPDFVEEAAYALDSAYTVVVEKLQYRAPPADSKDGPEWDCYMVDMGQDYGLTTPEDQIGIDPDIWTSFMRVDHDFTRTETQGLPALRVTIAHEFTHMCHLGYLYDPARSLFLYEANATWIEDRVYDSINDYYNYLGDFFETNNKRFDTADGWREYGLCVWFHFLARRLGTPLFAHQIWDELHRMTGDIDACDLVLRDYGKRFDDELGLFYAWNTRTGSRADAANYYPEGANYPEIDPDAEYDIPAGQGKSINVSVATTACRCYRFEDSSGDAFLFSLTDARYSAGLSSDAASLSLTRTPSAGVTRLDDGLYADFSAQDGSLWRPYVTVQKANGSTRTVAVDGGSAMFDSVRVPDAYPNPFVADGAATVAFPFMMDASAAVPVRLMVFTAGGIPAADLRYASSQTAGQGIVQIEDKWDFEGTHVYKIVWDGRNGDGRLAASGIYLYVILNGDKKVREGKLAIVR
jgi:hypothetical protein